MNCAGRLVVAAVLTLSGLALAEGGPPGGRRPPRPPKEAFEACASLKEGASCTVKAPDREISGTCKATPDAKLFCLPAGGPPPPPPDGEGPPPGPPPEGAPRGE